MTRTGARALGALVLSVAGVVVVLVVADARRATQEAPATKAARRQATVRTWEPIAGHCPASPAAWSDVGCRRWPPALVGRYGPRAADRQDRVEHSPCRAEYRRAVVAKRPWSGSVAAYLLRACQIVLPKRMPRGIDTKKASPTDM